MPERGQRDDAGAAVGGERGPQQVGQREVAEVVGGELRLEFIPAHPDPRHRARPDRGVVDEHVDAAAGLEEGRAGADERARGLEPEARVAAGDDREPAAEIDALEHLGRGAAVAKARVDRLLGSRHDNQPRTSSALEVKRNTRRGCRVQC